ncbi:hypothetical protein JHK84_034205 [Glycine max]|nr:hypothetical protein JHK86_033947 [Glycine max]KAG5140437.1 hypothetical protein JHK84_034205 [Glycine max]
MQFKTLFASNLSSVRLEHGSTESAHNSLPRFPIERNKAKSSLSNHVCHAGAAAAPRARPCHRLAPLHFLCLIHKKTKAHHVFQQRCHFEELNLLIFFIL